MARTSKPAPQPADAEISPEEGLNSSLYDVLDLLGGQVEKLKVALEFHRLKNSANTEVIRWHVEQIDQRQDRMDEVQRMILESGKDPLH